MRRSFFAVLLLSALVGCQGTMHPGFYKQGPYSGPAVDGPGPGVIPNYQPQYQRMSLTEQDMMQSSPGQMVSPPPTIPTTQINFLGVESLIIRYSAQVRDAFDSAPLVCPASHDFIQGQAYRIKLTNIPGQPDKVLYPTLEIAPTAARTQAFLAHSSVPIEFTMNDFDHVFEGNFVTKVVYLPNPEFQGIAMSGVGTLVSTVLQPGVDPITEASKRGAILAVIRMGNKDLSAEIADRRQQMAGHIAMQYPPMSYPAYAGAPMYPTNGTSIPQNAIAGVNIPPYGVPMTKTTTGVPGPPQLPVDGYYGPNRQPIQWTEPIPAPPANRTYVMPGEMIPNPYVPPMMGPPPMTGDF